MDIKVRRIALASAVAACTVLSLAAAASPSQASPGTPRPSSVWLRNGWLSPQNKLLSARIASDQRYLQRHGASLTQWGPDSVTGKTRVYLTHYTKMAARFLSNRYGNAIEVAPLSEPLGVLQARGSDTSPYIGGDFIYIPATNVGNDTGLCSGGPIVKNSSGQLRMLTAGHCTKAAGNFVFRSNASGQHNGPHMGNVTERVSCNDCIDVSVVDSSASGSSYKEQVWGQQFNTTNEPRYDEVGTAFPNPANCSGGHPTGCAGDLVTADSAFTGEVTGITVFAVDQSMKFGCGTGCTVTVRALSEACSVVVNAGNGVFLCDDQSAKRIGQGGDSGGPWIVHGSGSNVNIAGTTVGGNALGNIEFYEQIGAIFSKYNLTVP
jgi:hypothetical protein